MSPTRRPRFPWAASPAYLRPGPIALVLAGGTVGTAVRAFIEGTYPQAESGLPWATFAVNVSGALLLGLLVEVIALHRGRGQTPQRLRLLLGTGLLGGYTTYSTFILETVLLGTGERVVIALLYDTATLVIGFLAALTAMTAYRRWRLTHEVETGGPDA